MSHQRVFCAGSGLPQGPFWRTIYFHLEWVWDGFFVNGKWTKCGFLGARVGEMGENPLFLPTLYPFQEIDKNPLLTNFKGGGNCFPKRALRQP